MSGRVTKAQAERAADLATEQELDRFAQLERIQKIGIIFGEQAAIDEAAREARKLVRAILKGTPSDASA